MEVVWLRGLMCAKLCSHKIRRENDNVHGTTDYTHATHAHTHTHTKPRVVRKLRRDAATHVSRARDASVNGSLC